MAFLVFFIDDSFQATEIDENGTETNDSVTQTCVVFVADIDDNDPMFNFNSFTSNVDEDAYVGFSLSFKNPHGDESSINITDVDNVSVRQE